MPPRILIDANVLYRTRLRELLLAQASTGLVRPLWSVRIIEECASGLVRNGALDGAAREGFITSLSAPAYIASGHEALEGTFGLPDPDDEHVLAAAVHAGAGLILSFNLKDFPVRRLKPLGVRAEMPDSFFLGLLGDRSDSFLDAVEKARATIAPDLPQEEHFAMLRRAGIPRTVKRCLQIINDP
ncbi:PIN domain-containing protein [Rhizobium alvei]|uniref:PIN domain-containing protein n=1 Tax=Rhizobium alvei TaxID=1132659 RepID=A0ABT8YGQ6_9HYPH|nr:PIN domain-containing protein [Rhizobium alvei]MDO6962831.1 PIN domain-containing protein [Rhizobium alvei]